MATMLFLLSLPYVGLLSIILANGVCATGYATVASSGVAAQMVFLVPNTRTVVFIDKYHLNYGYPTMNLQTGAPNQTSWVYPGGTESVFGAELDLLTYKLRALRPRDDTSCSIGAFFPDGTLANIAGKGADGSAPEEGFNWVRTYAPGPCQTSGCTQNWVERGMLSSHRWYPTAVTMTTGDILVVGGATVGGLVINQANINNPTYEIVRQSTTTPSASVPFPFLNITPAQNLDPGICYNMYPMVHLLPNSQNANQMFTLAGNRSTIWDYVANKLVKMLPEIPNAPRTFPASAMNVLLPMSGTAPSNPEILVCGGSSADMPRPQAMDDCWSIQPYEANPTWVQSDSMPNGPQTMSNGLWLPDSTLLILNGARIGCAGSEMADSPVFEPLIYDPSAAPGSKFTTLPSTAVPRLYHSVALLLPSGKVLVAGSNPLVTYSATGEVGKNWPYIQNDGHRAPIIRQQKKTSRYPTEYRVEFFSPPYLSQPRPDITSSPASISYNSTFRMASTLNGKTITGKAQALLIYPGFSTHGQQHGQRMLQMPTVQGTGSTFTVSTPENQSVMPPGHYLLWMVVDGAPSTGHWISLQV